VIFSGFLLFSQDAPDEFDFNISIYQSFYFFLNSDIEGEPLVEGEDWIAAFSEFDETMGGVCEYIDQDIDGLSNTADCQDLNNDGILSSSVDICVGSFVWSGEYTTVPVMGSDGTIWTQGYMVEDQRPKFKIFDGSEGLIYNAVPSVIYPWSTDLSFYVISISVFRDCNLSLGGEAFIDSCGVCVEGDTGLVENYLDIGCGCYESQVGPFFEDSDGDGLGYGDEQYFCENPGLGWSTNNNDPEPNCVSNFYDCNNDCGGSALFDDCGVCSSGSTGIQPNFNLDCNGECFGFAYIDDCDECVGGSTGNSPCDFNSEQPVEFEFYNSTQQAFYFITSASFNDGSFLSPQDWIGVFNGDACVGSIKWDGIFTTVPAMGNDGSNWTQDYLNPGDFPTFKVYDASMNEFFETDYTNIVEVVGDDELLYEGWGNNNFYYVYNLLALSPDCNGVIGGSAVLDDCGICSGGSTGITINSDLDCSGVCFGDAQIDNCGVCSGGSTNNIPNIDDQGCGCFLNSPSDYFSDVDNDGFGSGLPQSFCQNPGNGWSLNNIDPEPFCYNLDTYNLNVDDCGICNGDNQDIDCLGICFGSSELDECGVCDGDNSLCFSPTVSDVDLYTSEDESFTFNLEAENPIDSDVSFIILQSPLNGSIVGSNDNPSEFSYVPTPNFNGIDSFQYIAFNGSFYSEEATVTVNVSEVNDPPTADSMIYDMQEDATLEFNLIGNDIENNNLVFNIVEEPLNGTLLVTGDHVSYTSDLNFFGEDQFTYIVNDGQFDSDYANVSIIVLPINDSPVSSDMSVSLYEDGILSFEFLASDVDNSIDDLSIWILDELDFGQINLDGLDAVFTPSENINGEFLLQYQTLDGNLFSDVSILTINIEPINDAPVLSSILNQY